MKRALFLSVLCLGSAGPAFAAVGAELPGYQVVIDLDNRASLQRGAKYFVNYCMGCHSLQYSRYSRVGEDLGLDMQMVADNLIFNGRRVSERMEISMSQDDAERWFGAKPPDLSMLARRKGPTYIYQYLMTFYADEDRPWGVNNWRFPFTTMPHVLWREQGLQRAEWKEVDNGSGTKPVITGLTLETPGLKTPEEYEQLVVDLTSFLVYVSEPARLTRESVGTWVLLFLLMLGGFAYFLKREYWKDVH